MPSIVEHRSDWIVDSIIDQVREKAQIYYDKDARSNSTKNAIFNVLLQLSYDIGADWEDFKLGSIENAFSKQAKEDS